MKAGTREADRQALAGARVLVAEDRSLMQTLIRGILNSAGVLDVVQVFSGDAALKTLRRERFDLFICDRNMPGMNGIDLVQRLRDADATLPVLMVTADTDEDTLREAVDAGVNDFLTKPISGQMLLDSVHKLLRRA